MRKFVIAVDEPTREQTRAISDIFRGKSFGWWHWIAGFWLVSDATDTLTAAWIRTRVHDAAPLCRNTILQVSPEDWSSFGPAGARHDMGAWLRNTWE